MKRVLIIIVLLSIFNTYSNNLKGVWAEKTEEELQEILDQVYRKPPRLI